MGFLDKLFAKKICDICGGEIGLLGNKKLEDGNCCKDCGGCGALKPIPANVPTAGWKCFCGSVNTGKFCQNCGTIKFAPEDIECSECSWTADTWHEDVGVPSNCPNCGKEFTSDDIS